MGKIHQRSMANHLLNVYILRDICCTLQILSSFGIRLPSFNLCLFCMQKKTFSNSDVQVVFYMQHLLCQINIQILNVSKIGLI